MHKVRGKYSDCTCGTNEKICNSNGGAQEKQDETEFRTKSCAFSEFDNSTQGNVLFCRFFLISPDFGPNLGLWCRVFLTLRKSLLYQDFRRFKESLHFIKFSFKVLKNQLRYQVFVVFKKSILKVSILINLRIIGSHNSFLKIILIYHMSITIKVFLEKWEKPCSNQSGNKQVYWIQLIQVIIVFFL